MKHAALTRSRSFLIAAHAQNRVIGHEGGIPWHAPHDLRFFARKTRGTAMVMGRATFESLPGILPDRVSIVVSSRPIPSSPAIRAASFEEAVDIALRVNVREQAISFIGGASIYAQALRLPWLEHAFVTRVDLTVPGDTFLPELGPEWTLGTTSASEPGIEPRCDFDHFQRHIQELAKCA